jgi:glucose/arabinose dehydrogenase
MAAAGLAAIAVAAVAAAAGPPPAPKAAGRQTVAVVARGVPTPTVFAFAGGQVFVAGFGDEQHPRITGGVYAIEQGKPVKLAGSPPHVFGLAYKARTLYVSAGSKILAWSGWNGTRFGKSRTVVRGPKGFTGFNGIAVASDGTLYAGVSVGDKKRDDYSKGTTPYANDVVAVDPSTGKIRVAATGMRQPWQPVFVPGHAGPLISDLGQENLGKHRPVDRIVEIEAGADFGFPACPAKPASCARYARPFARFPAHSSPMGLGSLNGRLYLALFGGTGKGPEVVAMSATGGRFTPFLTGFVAPVVALGVHAGKVYVGDLTGSIYSVRP